MRKKILIIIVIVFVLYLSFYLYNNNYYIDNDIPIIDIRLNDINLDEVHKDKKIEYKNNKINIYKNNKKEFTGKIGFKGRGNFTWTLDKKSYRISFDEKTKILDLPVSKKYVLLSNHTDSSLLKNDFTYSVAKKMNLNYSFTGEFIDLYIDKNYIGNYYITPKISISKNVVDLQSKDALLVELDNSYYLDEDEYFTTKILNDHIVLKDSNNKKYDDSFKLFEDKYNKVEECIVDQDFYCLEEKVDVDSFIKYYIISEFSENPDALQSSLFMYTDGNDDKIHIGPIWDFDIAYGLKPQYSSYDKFLIKEDLINEKETSKLFYNLMCIKEFEDKVISYWNTTAKDIYKEEIDNIDKKIKYLNKAGIFNNNYWGLNTFKRSTSIFKYWISNRYDFINNMIGNGNNE